ncbi:hypothetical protein F5Y12DRAFT_559025 [Xylaria sp. FL1777]|nr:hypothetical protein F5Y12DRAFT_559025 [Xylaria sp. FL1777]
MANLISASFIAPSRKGDAWFFAGLTSSFPNLTESGADILHEPRLCENGESVPGCKVFHVPSSDSSQAKQIEGDEMISHNGAALQDEVLIFQYRGKIHAIDNKCPHSAFPLASTTFEPYISFCRSSVRLKLLTSYTNLLFRAEGTPFDIEDFGLVLSAGISCPKHGWSFDLFTGTADRSNYMLRRWEVQLRPIEVSRTEVGSDDNLKDQKDAEEVWVRRKQRMG